MKSKFLKRIDHDRILAAICKVDAASTGEVHVQITHKKILLFQDEMEFARKSFKKLGLHRIPERNAVLIVVFPARRQVVLFGDQGIHSKLDDPCWNKILQKV